LERAIVVQNEEKQRALYYGGRKTDKLVRCYEKKNLGVFRVEMELHSGLLREIRTPDDFWYLPDVVYPSHFQFVTVDWRRLEEYLSNKFGDRGRRLFAGARYRSASLRRVRRYLHRNGVVNIHRFLAPLEINDQVGKALDRWARDFKTGSPKVKTK
jgi:hypothetical protein